MGLGAQLIGRAVVEYRRRGMHTVRLNVAHINKTAQRFYTRLGFHRDASLFKMVSRQIVMRMTIDNS
jgi:ribosomal protein S18 acetylase RimI-like enzyme